MSRQGEPTALAACLVSEPTALAAGLEVGRFDLQTVWPMLMFLIDFALKLACFSCWTTTSRPVASAVGSLFQQLKAHTVASRCAKNFCDGCFCVTVCTFAVSPAIAQTETETQTPVDNFYYAPAPTQSIDVWNHRASERLTGKIEELDDQRILYFEGEKRRELPSNRVAEVEPVWRTPAAEVAHKLFVDRKYREAKDAITKAATNDLPRWQQRIMVAEFVEVLAALGDIRLAGGVYVKSLAPNQPPAMLYGHLPMNWTTVEPNRALYDVAVEWLEHPNECAQLLGASWLLLGPDSESARGKLLKLQSSKVEPIAALAVAQAWRLVPPPETEGKITEWLEYRNRLIEPLQIGPTEFLAERLARVGMIDQAIGQWSRIATVHADRPHRAAVALTAAQRVLTQQGRADEAKRFQAWAEQFKLQ